MRSDALREGEKEREKEEKKRRRKETTYENILVNGRAAENIHQEMDRAL